MRPPRLSDLLDDLLGVFENNPEGITFAADLVKLWSPALAEARDMAITLERSVEILAEEREADAKASSPYDLAVERQQRQSRAGIPLDSERRIIALPNAVRGAL